MRPMPALYLASASPRRRELLEQIGVAFSVQVADVDESPLPAECPEAYVARLAQVKARAAQAKIPVLDAVVLGADTCVVLEGRILGKPQNREDALQMLAALSGRTHEVLTAVALAQQAACAVQVVRTEVQFRPLRAGEAEAYWDTGEPQDKAGSYGIQGLAAVFVREIKGSYSAVVGLPLCETAQMLEQAGIVCWNLDS